MLTALELYGFKSFADRTRFDFPPGITVVVGPNGSGKSNIVDAIKWVLGEQSPRSMRGKEMADVIFKGTSGPGGRKPANTAEATLILDNRSRRLHLDADDIRLTRRVYRSGEGEYLINGEPCRLKDIRNLIRGTGIGAESYSLIEQGKVDQLLKASPRDRRVIFEEAAGISRFKARKVEAERRLERVEQNLSRLGDIVDEVRNRYRRVQAQATKAARYQELTTRLQELRTHAGIKDWRDLSRHLAEVDARREEVAEKLAETRTRLESLENTARQLDVELSARSTRIAETQQQLNECVQTIVQRQSNIALNQSRADDFLVQAGTSRQSLERETASIDENRQLLAAARERLANAGRDCESTGEALAAISGQLETLQSEMSRDRQEADLRRQRTSEVSATISAVGKELGASESRQKMQLEAQAKLDELLAENRRTMARLQEQLHQQKAQCIQLQNDAASRDSALAGARVELESVRQELKDRRQVLDEHRRRQTGATQRAEVIQELENRLEGVDSGARDLMERARRSPEPFLREVVGLVADVIKVNVQHAELVDIALGPGAQSLIVDGESLVAELAAGRLKPNGRVRIIRAPPGPAVAGARMPDLLEEEGVIGRLDQLVQCDDRWQSLVEQLLGSTWLVKSLATALLLRERVGGKARFVTLAGELLDQDGTLLAGPRTASSGIVSRRSELRALHRDIHELSAAIRDLTTEYDQRTARRTELEERVQTLLGENTGIANRLAELNATIRSLEGQTGALEEQHGAMREERSAVSRDLQGLLNQIAADRNRLKSGEHELAELNSWLAAYSSRLPERERNSIVLQHEQTAQKVQLARLQQVHAEATRHVQELEQRSIAGQQNIASIRSSLAKILWAKRGALREMGLAAASLENLDRTRTELDQLLASLNDDRAGFDRVRRETAQTLAGLRDAQRKWTDDIHEIELRQRQLQMERQQLALRLREDYGIDITVPAPDAGENLEDREAIHREIGELRAAIGNIGSVNMDALTELEEMRQRYETLESQYRDLVESRDELGKIIHRINQDSRKLFSATVEAIRANFQVLFRQTFGGGRADLVVEEGVDILEAGIDIVATPPGKPEFSNSLLSGGERALTAVSLMMAVFQFRPSPFCVLDEVDAPFDEANIGRFIEVLRSFLAWTRFIIVTHSKRTMTAATTLYGVTMQESGVSRKVSVRFEDVSEDGSIHSSAAGDERTVA